MNGLPGTLTVEEVESWARQAERHNVRVTYRVVGQEQSTTRTMAHPEYLRWAREARNNGYQLLAAEQVRRE